jgi:uncharacterized protein (TIGR00730 family)
VAQNRRSLARRRRTGEPEIDALLKEVVELVGGADADLVAEAVATTVRLGLDGIDRGDLKIVTGALRELRRSFRAYQPYVGVPKVAVFGSARTSESAPAYAEAIAFAEAMVGEGWMVITGAGPGIMHAANVGAGPDASFGLNIRLPFEQAANPAIEADPKLVTFRYFFTRKLIFVKEAHAYAFFPGGFGTMDEAFEVLTLMQTGKSDTHPIVMIETPGDDYWERFVAWIQSELLHPGLIAPEDLSLFRVTHDVSQAVDEIRRFYSNYQSQRYVGDSLYLRLRRPPDAACLARLNEDFADIVESGRIELAEAHPDEVADGDALHLARVVFVFDRASFGRLRQLIDALNDL